MRSFFRFAQNYFPSVRGSPRKYLKQSLQKKGFAFCTQLKQLWLSLLPYPVWSKENKYISKDQQHKRTLRPLENTHKVMTSKDIYLEKKKNKTKTPDITKGPGRKQFYNARAVHRVQCLERRLDIHVAHPPGAPQITCHGMQMLGFFWKIS